MEYWILVQKQASANFFTVKFGKEKTWGINSSIQIANSQSVHWGMNAEGVLNTIQAWYTLLNWYAGVVDHSAMVLQKESVSRRWNSDVPIKNKLMYKVF